MPISELTRKKMREAAKKRWIERRAENPRLKESMTNKSILSWIKDKEQKEMQEKTKREENKRLAFGFVCLFVLILDVISFFTLFPYTSNTLPALWGITNLLSISIIFLYLVSKSLFDETMTNENTSRQGRAWQGAARQGMARHGKVYV